MPRRSASVPTVLSWVWFPAALLVLFLLAIPGFVLFVLHLLNLEPEVNAWLHENLSFDYSLALPAYAAFLLLLVPVLILILYFLKLKRRPMQVPSTFLWKKSVEDLHVNALLQWLRRNVLLLLQLLIVLVMIYAVMNFRVFGNITGGRHYILMIDNSASMATRDAGGQTRLEWAKQEATKEIDAANDNDFGMVIAFNSKATTLQTYTNNRAMLRQAVQSIRQTQRPTNIDEALKLADSLANPRQSAEQVASRPEDEKPGQERTYDEPRGQPTDVLLYSDGRFPELGESDLAKLASRQMGNQSALGNLNLQFHSAGTPGADKVNNIGIVHMNAVRLTEKDGSVGDPDQLKLQVLVVVRNFRANAATGVKLHVDVRVNGELIHPAQRTLERIPGREVKDLEVAGKKIRKDVPGEQEVTITLPPINLNDQPVVHAYLAGVQDDFSLDDQAWLAFGRPRKARVVIVGPPNQILDAFFNQPATRKVADVKRLAPEELDKDTYRKAAAAGEADLVLFDRCAPKAAEDLPQANTFFIYSVPPPWEIGKKRLKYPVLMVSKRNDPLLRQITTLWDLRTVEAFAFHPWDNLPEKTRDQYTTKPDDKSKKLVAQPRSLIEASGNVPVIFTLPRGSYSDLVMAFPLLDDQGNLVTDWPFQPSFPLFLRNVLYHLGNVNETVRAPSVQPGEPVKLHPEAGVSVLTFTSPKGQRQQLGRGNHPVIVYGDTEDIGVYQVHAEGGVPGQFTVNLLSGVESNIEPLPAVRIGEEVVASGQTREQPFAIWKWVVVLALGLLVVEWYVYNRRVHI